MFQTIILILHINPNHMNNLTIQIMAISEFTQFIILQQIGKIHLQNITQIFFMMTLFP